MSQKIVTYRTYEAETNLIEKNLKENVEASRKMLEDFEKKMDGGDYADQALHYVLTQNLENARKAQMDFIKLPISGHTLV